MKDFFWNTSSTALLAYYRVKHFYYCSFLMVSNPSYCCGELVLYPFSGTWNKLQLDERIIITINCAIQLHFRQNDRGLLRLTAVTRWWNGYRNKSQHRKLTLEKKVLLPLLQGLDPGTFPSRIRRSNH